MFVRAGKGCSSFIAGCTLLFASTVIDADQQPGYRLAGILELRGKPSIAIVESDGARQELVRVGDVLGDGEVVRIDAHSIRVATAAGVVTLTLEYGFADLTAAAEEAPRIANLAVDEQKL